MILSLDVEQQTPSVSFCQLASLPFTRFLKNFALQIKD
jgi:hypothetical protein